MRPSTSHPGVHRPPGAVALAALAAAFLLACLALAPSAFAEPPQLWQKCDADEPAGQVCVGNPRGVAADPDNGHVFLADQEGPRVLEFDPLGNFARAWGWDVVASGPGDDTTPPEDQFEVCVPEEGDLCKAGIAGAGAGQFNPPTGVALDSAGNIYIVDHSNRRVQKFSPAGQFLLTFGGDVNQTKVEAAAPQAQRNLCPVDPDDVCKAGVQGTGDGQFGQWAVGDFIEIHTAGTPTAADDVVYVGDQNRVQEFDPAGNFLGQIELPGITVQSLALDPAGNLYIAYLGGENFVHKLSPAGAPLGPDFELPKPSPFAPQEPTAVAVGAAGDVWAFGPGDCCGSQDNLNPIYHFDTAGKLLENFGKGEFDLSTGLATNLCAGSEPPGNLYVVNLSNSNPFLRAYGTAPDGCFSAFTGQASQVEETTATLNGTVNPKGSPVSECRFEYGPTTAYGSEAPCAESPAEIGEGETAVPVHADLTGLAAATVHHFRLRATIGAAAEKGADATFKTKGPPLITDPHTVSATDTEATVAGLVNPEGLPTTYRFQYLSEADYLGQGESFDGPATQMSPELALGSDRAEHPVSTILDGLQPATTYRWRLLAQNTALHQEGRSASPPLTFTTYPSFSPAGGCANEALREGASRLLPDCRAYELVSPIDKNGGDIVAAQSTLADSGGFVQSTPEGEAITYTSLASFGGQPNAFRFNQYLARRGGEGWSSEGIHPPANGKSLAEQQGFYREFMAFTPDLCSAWLVDYQDPPLVEGAAQGYPNLLRRDNCAPGVGALEALTVPEPPPLPAETDSKYVYPKSVQAVTPDGAHALFTAVAQLSPEAAPCCAKQLYDRFAGKARLVSVLPNGEAAATAVGVNAEAGSGWEGSLAGALSADGERAYWSLQSSIYLREHPGQGRVAGECDPAGLNACTREVSEQGPGYGGAMFWAATPDGSAALFTQFNKASSADELRLYDAESKTSLLIAPDVRGVAGHGDDLQRVYFVSNLAIAGAGANSPWGDEALAGKPNLYLWQAAEGGGETSFVGTLVEGEVGQFEPGATFRPYDLAANFTYQRATRASADGAVLAFDSRAPLTDYDNTAPDGRPAVEVHRYDAETGELTCVSCNPSGARPTTRELREPYTTPMEDHPTKVTAAAWIPTWEHPTHASGVLSADGSRLFFNSNDALLPRDTNGAPDVYQWEAAGTGACSAASPSYLPQRRGCIDLISSGQSPAGSEFWEADADGSDVFFNTAQSLVSTDPGLIDLYDARIGGGYAEKVAASECEGEACQSPPPAPRFEAPASGAYKGPGNLKEAAKKKKCPKGSRKVTKRGKARCTKKRSQRVRAHHRRAAAERRGAR